MSRLTNVVAIALLVTVSSVAARRRAVSPTPSLDPRRSFAVTDQVILDGFPFERVMNALAGGNGLAFYQQWLDTQNPKPGLDPAAPHCDDFTTGGKPSYNGFTRRCPTPEGPLAHTNPFTPAQYIPLALINRFDLAAPDGSNCGQYRLIYARRSPIGGDRLHISFEAMLPNPAPAAGLAGCRGIAQFWAELSGVDAAAERRARLEQFFFAGLPGFAPVVAHEHLGGTSGGSIRSFHHTSGSGLIARMYQFRLAQRCDPGCRLLVEPDALQNVPAGNLFDATRVDPLAVRFRDEFIRQIPNLAIRDVNRYFMNIPREFLIAESDPGAEDVSIPFTAAFHDSLTEPEGQAFQQRIEAELGHAGSTLTPTEVIRRAESQTCVGCHVVSGPVGEGVAAPPSFGFEHLSEDRVEEGQAGTRFAISPAMRDVFIPHRMQILRKFLASVQ